MMKDSKQRLFEVMGRLDESFKPLNENKAISDVVNDDILKLIFSPEEMKLLEKADSEDLKTFNQTMDNESPYYDPFGYYRNDEMEYVIQDIMKNKGIQINDETIKFLAEQVHLSFL